MPNTKAEVLLFWGDQEYLFRLTCAQIEELQRVCGDNDKQVSLLTIHWRLMSGVPLMKDVQEPIRLGLIGGGLAPKRAHELIGLYGQPPFANVNDPNNSQIVARLVLDAAWFGIDEIRSKAPPSGEDEAGSQTSLTSRPSEPSSSETASIQPSSTE